MTNWDIFTMALLANLTGQLLTTCIGVGSYVLVRDLRGRWREAREHERNT